MYAHDVIDDIRRTLVQFRQGRPSEATAYLDALKKVCPLIRDSRKFHMGDVSDLENLIPQQNGQAFFTDDPEYLRLPYPVTWFDFSFSDSVRAESCNPRDVPRIINSKEAVLVSEFGAPSFLVAYFFSYIKELAMWIPAEFCAFIAIGGCRDINKVLLDKMTGQSNAETDKGTISAVWFVDAPPEHKDHLITREYNLNFRLLEVSLRVLNCKNIRSVKIPAPEKLNKKRAKSGKTPLFSYHVLDIALPGQGASHQQTGTAQGGVQRVHLCRGHIKHYTSEAPLMGRHVGAYWWEPQLRGRGAGIVAKDYNVRLGSDRKA